jgi:hypothetical protein
MFYQQPRALLTTVHADCGIEPVTDYSFAASANSVPIGAEEFYEAQAHYPIVFTTAEPATAVVVLGLEQDRNLFVLDDHSWRPGSYIPAYVRRYPFVFVTNDNDFVLGVDEAAASFSRTGGQPLFENGEPSAMTKRAIDFCSAFQVQDRIVREFTAALQAHDLLIPHRADFQDAGGQGRRSLTGFTMIDEPRFTGLADEVFLDWRKRNWLGLVYAHLLSMRRWRSLAPLLDPTRMEVGGAA